MNRQRVIYGIARWVASVAAFALAAVHLRHALFSATPPGYQHPQMWEYSAYLSIGRALAMICIGIFFAINIRSGWPNMTSKWNVVLLGSVLVALIWPRACHLMEIDACLDSESRLDYEYQRCSSDV